MIGLRVPRAVRSLKIWQQFVRHLSAASAEEHIVRSPYPNVPLPKERLHDLVWKDVHKWADRTALECAVSGRSIKYAEARARSRSIAAALQGVFGLQTGDRFAFISPNSTDYLLVALAASEAAVVVTTINPAYSANEIASQFKDSEPKLVLTVPSKVAEVRKAAEKIGRNVDVVVVKDETDSPAPPGTISLDDVLAESSKLSVETRGWAPDDNVFLLYSSGTTGLPKGVQLCHRTVTANLVQLSAPEVRYINPATESWQEQVLIHLPLFHCFGLVMVGLEGLKQGARVVTLPYFDPCLFIQSLHEFQITNLCTVPPIINLLGSHPAVTPDGLSSLRTVVYGAAPCGEKDIERFQKNCSHNISILQGYGMTEASPLTHIATADGPKRVTSCGMLIPNTTAKIIDVSTGQALPPHQKGEICIKGPQVMKGYLNKPKATSEMITEDGWLRTGDIGYYDDDNYFYIVDRIKELIKVKGLQVAPAELEEILRSHPLISDAAVVGVPDERAGEVPKAFVVASAEGTLTEQAVQNFVATQVAEFKQLKGGVTFLDSIPRTASGKILRRELRTLVKSPGEK